MHDDGKFQIGDLVKFARGSRTRPQDAMGMVVEIKTELDRYSPRIKVFWAKYVSKPAYTENIWYYELSLDLIARANAKKCDEGTKEDG